MLAALKHGLWHELPFCFDLMIHTADTIEDVLHHYTKWIVAEEEKIDLAKKIKFHKSVQEASPSSKKFEKRENK